MSCGSGGLAGLTSELHSTPGIVLLQKPLYKFQTVTIYWRNSCGSAALISFNIELKIWTLTRFPLITHSLDRISLTKYGGYFVIVLNFLTSTFYGKYRSWDPTVSLWMWSKYRLNEKSQKGKYNFSERIPHFLRFFFKHCFTLSFWSNFWLWHFPPPSIKNRLRALVEKGVGRLSCTSRVTFLGACTLIKEG